jgi:hypothetical protein
MIPLKRKAFHGCPVLQVGATGINQPTNENGKKKNDVLC